MSQIITHPLTHVVIGCIFETTIPTVSEKGFCLERIVVWATNRTSSSVPDSSSLPHGEALACQFLARCLELDPTKRMSAEEALLHDFLNYYEPTADDNADEWDGNCDGEGDGEGEGSGNDGEGEYAEGEEGYSEEGYAEEEYAGEDQEMRI